MGDIALPSNPSAAPGASALTGDNASTLASLRMVCSAFNLSFFAIGEFKN